MNDSLIERFTDLFVKRGSFFAIENNIIFTKYNNMIVPFGPVNEDYSLTKPQAKNLLKKLDGILVRWTDATNEPSQKKEWYAVTCNNFISIDLMKSKHKNEISRGLNNCEVKRIDPEFLSKIGYDVFVKANKNYKNSSPITLSREDYARNIMFSHGFEDIVHYWGCFSKGKLIGYSSNYIFDPIEVAYTTVKFDPDYLNLYPSYALFYEMNKYYLSENNFEYVNDGFRSILHETNIQQYLIKKFNFTKTYLNLNIYYKPIFNMFVKTMYPFKNLTGKVDKRFDALFELERIRRNG
jgi:hypothetical protein